MSISITKVPEKLNSDVALVRVLELESVEQLVVVGQLVHELQVLVRLLGRERPPEVTHLVPLLLRLDQLSKVAGSDVVLQTKQSFLCAAKSAKRAVMFPEISGTCCLRADGFCFGLLSCDTCFRVLVFLANIQGKSKH